MTYQIISTNGNQTQISVEIDSVKYTNLIVCNDGELDDAVATFVDSIKNPRTFELIEAVDLNALVQSQVAIINALTARITALESA